MSSLTAKNRNSTFQTLVEALEYHAQTKANQLAYRFYSVDMIPSSITFAEVAQQAKAIAVAIREKAQPNDRALLVYPPGLELITAFFGCLYAGVIAIPGYMPTDQKTMSKLFKIIRNATPSIALTTQTHSTLLDDFINAKNLPNQIHNDVLQVVITDHKSIESLSANWQQPKIDAQTLAFLQYSSGSTGDPKGVMVSHENLLHNIALIQECADFEKIQHTVSWLPPYHDMGLIGTLLNPMVAGIPSISTAPSTFLRNPISWLTLITNYPNTFSGAPNFAYDYCVNKITNEELSQLDLSHWNVAFNGAEHIRLETLTTFYERFKTAGFKKNSFCPCYGLAEATLMASFKIVDQPIHSINLLREDLKKGRVKKAHSLDQNEKVQSMVGCGKIMQQIAIVDPIKHVRVAENTTGEIWLNSKSIAKGYWNMRHQTEYNFERHIKNDNSQTTYLRTGDLGFIDSDFLYITGRIKDLIIIHGANHYPQDIEQTIAQCDSKISLGNLCAFTISDQDEEVLSVVCGIKKIDAEEYKILIDKIIDAVERVHQLAVHSITFIPKGSIPKTTSGKIKRSACKKLLEDHELQILYQFSKASLPINSQTPLSTNSIANQSIVQEYITSWIAELKKQSSSAISATEPFAYYGIDSIAFYQLIVAIEKRFDLTLEADRLFTYSTPEKLATHLEKKYLFKNKSESLSTNNSNLSSVNNEETNINYAKQQTDKINIVYNSVKSLREEKIIGLTATPFRNQPNYYIFKEVKPTPMVGFFSCSYLGLEWDERLRKSAIEALNNGGSQFSCSRAYVSIDSYREFEELLTQIYGVAPIIAPTTTLAHLSALPILVDHTDAIILDEQVHNSVQMAAKICVLNGSAITKIKHNSVEELETAILKYTKLHKNKIWYLADGLYSMFGDFTPMPALLDLMQKYPQFYCYIDDAHSLGWLGAKGSGHVAEFKNHPCFKKIVISGSFAKAYAAVGGLILTENKEWRDKIIFSGDTMIFSGPIQPPLLGTLIASAKIFLSDEIKSMQKELTEKIALLNSLLSTSGLECLSSGKAPIFYVRIGVIEEVKKLCHFLHTKNYHVVPTGFPAVNPNQAGIRITLNRLHEENDLRNLVNHILEFKNQN